MKRLLVLAIFLAGCAQDTFDYCGNLPPTYFNGEKAIFTKTGEEIRITGRWVPLVGTESCKQKYNASYVANFADGSELGSVSVWDLRKITPVK